MSELPTFQASATQMAQLFLILIGNGIKFQGSATPRIEIKTQSQPDEWLISVQDNCIGLKPICAERIFHIFQLDFCDQLKAGTSWSRKMFETVDTRLEISLGF